MTAPSPRSDADREARPRMPRWVRVSAIIVGILIVLFLVLQLTGIAGEHGPGRHMSGSGPSPVDFATAPSGPAAVFVV